MARAIYNSMASDGSVAFSYGTNVEKQKHEGKTILDCLDELGPGLMSVFITMEKHGMDIRGDICEQLEPEYLKDAFKIIVMTEKEDIPEWLHKYDYDYWKIPNPEIVTDEVAEQEFYLLKDKIDNLIVDLDFK